VSWGVSEGGNVIAPDSEAVFYGILDLLAKPVFGALLIWGHHGIDPARLGLRIRDYDEDPAITGGIGAEKTNDHQIGVTSGTNEPTIEAAPNV
jgi:bacteriorhodopsin